MIINCSIAHSYSLVFTLVHFHFHSPLVFTSVHSCSLAFYSCSLVLFLCSFAFNSCSLVSAHLSPLVFTFIHPCSVRVQSSATRVHSCLPLFNCVLTRVLPQLRSNSKTHYSLIHDSVCFLKNVLFIFQTKAFHVCS